MRDVRLLEPRDLVVAQRELARRRARPRCAGLRRADDRRGDARLVQQPGQRDLRRRNAALRGDLRGAVDDGEVDLGVVERVGERIGVGPGRQPLAAARPVAREQPARERAPRHHARRPGRCTAGSSPAPPRGIPGCSGSASRRSGQSPRRTAPSRTATRTCCSRRCSAPCRPVTTSCSASIVSSIGVR